VSTAVAFTVTPGIKAPELSVTVPVTDAENPAWLKADVDTNRHSITAIKDNLFIKPPPKEKRHSAAFVTIHFDSRHTPCLSDWIYMGIESFRRGQVN
jgi:hypothetical protein